MKLPPTAARRYASALLSLALDAGVQTRVADDMASIARALEQSGELSAFLGNTLLPAAARRTAIAALFRDRIHPLAWNMVMVLESNRRLALLPAICGVFKAMDEDRRGIVRGEMSAAAPVPPDIVDAMAVSLGSRLGRTVRLRARENPDLLGGCRVQVGDRVYDFSLAARLRLARQAMTGA